MKKFLMSLVVCLLAVADLHAQTIQNGSKWFDGSVLYTAHVQGNTVKMDGIGEHEGGFCFELIKVDGKSGEYILAGTDVQAASLRAKVGWRVQYVRQDGMYFLAIRNTNGDAVWEMTLTPDNLENSLAFERYLEQQPVSDQLANCLLNTAYLGRFSKDQLRIMRNEILARHGWKFQSKDLQEYFGRQSWYKPGNDNNAIKLHVIEQLNIQLIKSEESVPDTFRSYGADASAYVGGLADDGRGAEESTVTVANEDQFIDALASDRVVELGVDVHLNLSRILEQEAKFRHVKGRRWTEYGMAKEGVGSQPEIISENCFDGHQLILKNFKNLTIRGKKNSSIEVEPRYSYCLSLLDCEGCTIENLTIGHTEGGYCDGGVIEVKGGKDNSIWECDLYGCGTYGFTISGTKNCSVYNSKIHDCTYGIMQVNSSLNVKFFKSDFFNNREFSLCDIYGCSNTEFSECRFFANHEESPLFMTDSPIRFYNCEIYHPLNKLGDKENFVVPQNDLKLVGNPLDPSIKSRGIGPDTH